MWLKCGFYVKGIVRFVIELFEVLFLSLVGGNVLVNEVFLWRMNCCLCVVVVVGFGDGDII